MPKWLSDPSTPAWVQAVGSVLAILVAVWIPARQRSKTLRDAQAEKARLEKEAKRLDGEIEKIDKKLGNNQFLERAPAEVVAELRERRADYAAALEKVRGALEMLGS